MSRASSLADAYEVLGLEQDATLELVKNTYKQAALRTHPDKNPDNPDATAEFQRVGEAYNILLKHLDTSHDDSDDDSEDGFANGLNFYVFLFESFMHGRAHFVHRRSSRQHGRTYMSGFDQPHFHPPPPECELESRETVQEEKQRLRRTREEQEAAELRRQREAAVRREVKEKDRQQERLAAERRQKAKNGVKRAKAEAQRQQAEDAAHIRREKMQKNRSAVFQAAREGNTEEVKKGIWENDVDAAGGEVKPGYEEFVKIMPKDPKETLLHIAARKGDLDLVEWLDKHSAEIEERNSQSRTAFHIAVQHGHHEILAYLINQYSPKDSDHKQIYGPPPSTNVLSLALQSHEPQVVYMVLQPNNGLADSCDINNAWSWINSPEGRKAMTRHSKGVYGNVVEKFNDICTLLRQYGGFTPPPTPILNRKDGSSSSALEATSHTEQHQRSQTSQGRGRGRGRGKGR
ncbi:hypothetical protein J3R30DRAFT_3362939 [Lentinula aciculospora]|uniref:J domain-containing protein n=1 Tax=Lentinula aciculospora TaxID=153920 RepID=A0A9W9DVE2_9AGAR|nr:hypothetical protein J3R30DRAFT_3362939 [Lentinula aciculospora]